MSSKTNENEGKNPTEQDSRKYRDMLLEVESIVKDLSLNKQDLDDVTIKVKQGFDLVKAMKLRLEETRMQVERMQVEQTR